MASRGHSPGSLCFVWCLSATPWLSTFFSKIGQQAQGHWSNWGYLDQHWTASPCLRFTQVGEGHLPDMLPQRQPCGYPPSAHIIHSCLWGPSSGLSNWRIGCLCHCLSALCIVQHQQQWMCFAQCHCELLQGSQCGNLMCQSGQDCWWQVDSVLLHVWLTAILWMER